MNQETELEAVLPISVGDYVIPAPDGDEEDWLLAGWDRLWTPCRVRAVYKNGNLRARSDDGRTSWQGPVPGFRKTYK